MTSDIARAANAVLFPAFDNWDLDADMRPFLDSGGCSLLVGESRQEYVQRRMSEERRDSESPDLFRAHLARLKASTDGLIVAVDEELAGIRRLEGLVPDLPSLAAAIAMPDADLEAACFRNAAAARELGVTMYLAPIVDVVDGTNPWLLNRTLGRDPDVVARLGAAFVRGVQKAGIATATKHFPGFNHLPLDPALTDVVLETETGQIEVYAETFAAMIAAGTRAVMVGPAAVRSIDPINAACVSPAVISMLREKFGFTGLVISDDLDAPATARGQNLIDTAVASLNAGAELLLFSGRSHLRQISEGLVEAVSSGDLSERRLLQAAERVRSFVSS
ncbi:MAG: glycoside hydrolase family 3 protein [Mesorhizobium sp.]|uniref:glycoside hydrolase family 3 N-terminal domain-containing protein n=1 Tax=Mesorhizobium sp. TaxID=1871066 RepID=UPI000FE96AE7|nr:glycoside hydrolase family 3 N-terminal domain-containing protein [Mesorhizobium sp.]RWE14261.1 MAG: glycoside hydrolase family 3 protein [Mesorhizobium sp.]TIS66418.1 MAG: glycoside hydrolase family 3 protein [Mesorhizobium sp.]TIW50515.1 MAG: glycoside hydrolase family 3 protein [Mesorhizobium sp.]